MNLTPDQSSTNTVDQVVREMAKRHGVDPVRTPVDALAAHFTHLSGDEPRDLDETQHLIIALRRAGFLSKIDAMKLQARHLAEKKLAV